MAEEDGYGIMEEMDFDWVYVEDDYPLSVRVSRVLLRELQASAYIPRLWNVV